DTLTSNLSLHDALPICVDRHHGVDGRERGQVGEIDDVRGRGDLEVAVVVTEAQVTVANAVDDDTMLEANSKHRKWGIRRDEDIGSRARQIDRILAINGGVVDAMRNGVAKGRPL